MGICCMAKKLKQGLCSNLEGWDGEGDGQEEKKETAPLTNIIRQFCTKEKKLWYFVHGFFFPLTSSPLNLEYHSKINTFCSNTQKYPK